MTRRSRRMTRRMRGGLSGLEEAIGTFTAANTAYDPDDSTTKDTFVKALNTFIGELIAVRDKIIPPLQQRQGDDDEPEEQPTEASPPTPPGGGGGRRSRRRRKSKKSRRHRKSKR